MLIFTISLFSSSLYSDALPPGYPFLSFLAEGVVEVETPQSKDFVGSLWGGIGIGGSFFYFYPYLSIAVGAEERYYLNNKGNYQDWFIGGFLALSYWGVIPGARVGYKISRKNNLVFEPYVSLSIQPTYVYTYNGGYFYPFPVLTLGIRVGFDFMKNWWSQFWSNNKN